VFSKAILDTLVEWHLYDYKIKLINRVRLEDLKYSLLRKITFKELKAYKKYITENLGKGFIKISALL